MAGANRFTPVLLDITSPDITIGHITELGPSPGVQAAVEHAGKVDAQAIFVEEIKPTLAVGTGDLSHLATLGYQGSAVTTAAAYFEQYAANSDIEADGCLEVSYGAGLMVPVSVSASHGQRAALNAMLYGTSADDSAIVTVTTDQSLPTGSGISAGYTVGPCEINGTTFEVESMTWTFGLQVVQEAHSGHIYPDLAYIARRAPSVSLVTRDAEALSTLSAGATALTGDGCIGYFRKKSADGQGNVADGTAQHVSLQMANGIAHVEDLNAEQTQITVTARKPSAAVILVISTTAAIT